METASLIFSNPIAGFVFGIIALFIVSGRQPLSLAETTTIGSIVSRRPVECLQLHSSPYRSMQTDGSS